MTIGIGNIGSDEQQGGISITLSHTIASGIGKILFVGTTFNNDDFEVVSGITYDGVAMDFVGSSNNDDDARSEIYRMYDPPVGTADIVVTLDQALIPLHGFTVGAIDLTEVAADTPVGDVDDAIGDSLTASVVIASASGELVLDTVAWENEILPTVGSGQTERWNIGADDPNGQTGSGSTEPGAASVTMSWTYPTGDKWATLALAILPSEVPVVDAGGPYTGDVDVPELLAATVTPGTDGSPTFLWTIDSGPGSGVFTPSATVEDPSFEPDAVGTYTLRLTVSTLDTADVFDTASFESESGFVAPTVEAGGPYNGDVDVATALAATVTPGSDPTPVLTWTIDSGPGSGAFLPSASVEDPTFTPDTVGSYVLKLEANPSDGAPVSDTANFESDPVAAMVDAGGPYNGPSGVATALDATVTPGSDPTPVLLWTIDSGGAGSFSNDAIEDPTFTPTFPTIGAYVLRLTVTPSDIGPVFDTADFESDAIAPTVDAGGPYMGDVSTPIQLDGTVTPGTDPAPTLMWTIDSGGTGTFSDATIEDPTFTADGIGPYILRLTVAVSDGPNVFDTADLTTISLADPVFLGGRLLRGGTGDLVTSELSLGADPPGGDVVYIKGTAHSNAGAMYVAIDDGVEPRVFIAGIAHQHNGVRLVTFNTPVVNLNAWGLDANGAQGIAAAGAGFPHEGILLRGDGQIVVDGVAPPPPGPPIPPFLPDLLHWFDFADSAVLWQDAAGTVPIVAGQDVVRVDNKGTDGTPLIEAFPPGGTWTLNLVNGLAGLVNGTNFSASQQTGWLGAGAARTMFFSWGRRTDNLANSTTGVMWQQAGMGGDDELRGDNAILPGDWAVAISGIPTPTSTTRAIVNNEWNWVYGGADNVGAIVYRASGSAKQTMAGVYGSPAPPQTMSWGLPRGEQIEVLVYGRGLTSLEQNQVTAYFNARAGRVLPFVEGVPAQANLQHWFDMTDQSTQWQNSAGTIPAANGFDIDRIDNKGTDGQPLIDTLGGRPFFTDPLINGLPGWDDGGGSGQLTTTITNGGSANGIAWAGVIRRDVNVTAGMFSWNGPSRLLRTDLGGNWEAFVSPPPTVQDTGKLVIDNEWVWVYFSQDGATGDWKLRASGEAEVTGTNAPFAANSGGNSMTLSAGPDGKMAEWLIWDRALTDGELSDLIEYFDGKYGVLPF